MSEEKILSSFAGARRQGSLKEKHHVPYVCVLSLVLSGLVLCGVVEGRECETRRNGTDSTDNSRLREEEGRGKREEEVHGGKV
jgi:hypothetical protein